MSTNSLSAAVRRPAVPCPGTLTITGTRVAISKQVCLFHSPWPPRGRGSVLL